MKHHPSIGLAILAAILALSAIACHRQPIESLAPAPVQLPAEPPREDPFARGQGNVEALPAIPSDRVETGPRYEEEPVAAPAAPKVTLKPKKSASSYQAPKEEYVAPKRVEARPRKSAKPSVMVLINRKFVGSVDEWKSDSRLLISEAHEENGRNGSSTEAISIQNRVGGERNVGLSEDALWQVQDYFTLPLRQAGYPVVDPEVATRLTAEATRGREPRPERDSLSIETKALRENADWLVELLITPSRTDNNDWVMAAKAVDLDSSRVIAYISSQSLPKAPHFPGAPQKRNAKPLDKMAEELSFALLDQLPR